MIEPADLSAIDEVGGQRTGRADRAVRRAELRLLYCLEKVYGLPRKGRGSCRTRDAPRASAGRRSVAARSQAGGVVLPLPVRLRARSAAG